MGGAAVVLCTALACVNSLTQVERQETKLSATDNQLLSQNKDLNNMQIQAAASLQFQGLPVVDNMDDKIIVKRATVKKAKDAKKKVRHHVKKAKNSKKRKKLFDKRRKSVESESESKQTKSLSKSEESEKSETAPDSDSSAQKSKSGKTKSSKSSSSFSYEDTSSSVGSEDYSSDTEDSDYSSDDSDTEDSDDDKTKPTEEVSLSSVEKSVSSIEPLHSGLDSSPPASSDSEFESSASKTPNSEDSSEISYTMSSSAEDAFPTDDTIEEGSGSGSGEEEDKSKSTPSKKKSEETPKVETEVKKKKGKKITKNNIKLNNKNNLLNGLKSGEKKDLKLEKNGKNKMGKSSKILSTSQHLQATTDKVLNMAHMGNKVDVEEKTNTNTRPQLEMLKVKPAADPHKKMVLENDLNADYPLNETVEIRNWQGTLAPIIGEPYVAPLHQQPDSFWDAIYRSTDTDLPTPMGAGSAEATTLIPELYAHQLSNVHAEVPGLRNPKNIEMKNKDKGKKEKKKPKLSIKEKKKKKREKQENKNPNNLVASGTKIKAAGAHGEVQHPVMMGDDHKNHHETAHILAAGKSGDNLKTPSEEERESGTTYKPEGAYEYPSFRHPDFNPDTAYDENGIPIHESPGWTEPPTLPGDRRFGKERARPGAAAGMAAHTHVHEQVVRPQATHSQSMVVKVGDHAHTAAGQMIQQPGELNSHMAAQQHQQVAEALVGSHLHLHPENHNGGQPQLLIDPLSQTHVGVETVGAPLYLPAHHPGATIRESEVNHNIHKREAAKSGESLEAISSVMSTRELHHHAAQYNQRQAQHNNQAYSTYPDSEEEVELDDKDPIEAYQREKELRATQSTGTPRTKRPLKNAQPSTLGFKLRPRFTTESPTPRQPYTGYMMNLRQRRQLSRKLPPLPPLHTPTPPTPPPSTTWWPPGVPLRSRPTIPLHAFNPNILKWEMKIPPIWIRTGKTIKTYAPHIENYPVTFNWNVPRASRRPSWTERPGWPLDSPLFGSIYDYLEEPSYPPVLASGETEFPITSPEPWWTYPPWWMDKVAAEVNGTTPRPTRGQRQQIKTRFAVTRPTTTVEPTEINMKSNLLEPTAPTSIKPKTTPTKRVIHHNGPWWKLTVVEHPADTSQPPATNNRVKRRIPLRRQNAIRRKWRKKSIDPATSNQTEKKDIQSSKGLPPVMAYTQLQQSKHLIEGVLGAALSELKQRVLNSSDKVISNSDNNMELSQQLSKLHNIFLTSLHEFNDNNSGFMLELTAKELKLNILSCLFIECSTILDKIEEFNGEERIKYSSKSQILTSFKILGHLELFCKHNLISKDKMFEAINIIKNVYKTDSLKVLKCKIIHNVSRTPVINYLSREGLQNSIRRKVQNHERFKRERKIIDLNQSPYNWSSQSMEKLVDELVDELPMKTIQKEVKADLISEVYSEKLRKAAKPVNKELFAKMVGFDIEDSNIEKATINSVKEVILKLLKEVLTNLRENKWMKEAMMRLFEEGYSVDSVVDAITNEISIESLLESLKGGAINITSRQEEHVLSQFKEYKVMLNQMIKREVLLWEYQLSKNFSDVAERPKRSVTFGKQQIMYNGRSKCKGNLDHVIPSNCEYKKEYTRKVIENDNRFKRNTDDNEVTNSKVNEQHLDEEFDIDDELSALEKSSMPEEEKIKKLKKRLKWLQSQTENPADITFPEDFEEQLMQTEGYHEDKTRAPRITKQRFQWNVRTKKPTVRVVTFLPKIRLTRGKPFVPLTTTDSPLELPETFPPTRRLRTRRTSATMNLKTDSTSNSNLQTFRRQFWMDYTQKTSSPRILKRPRSFKRLLRTTAKSVKTFPTVKTFRTMKFDQRTKQPVISLQEFLKRRNEFRKVRNDGLWKKNTLTTSEEITNDKIPAQGNTEEEEDLTEELSFEAKLSGEINAGDFTLRPLSDFLFTKNEETTTVNQEYRSKTVADNLKGLAKSKLTIKPTRRRFTKKTGYTRLPRAQKTGPRNKATPSNVERSKRDIPTTNNKTPPLENNAKVDVFSPEEDTLIGAKKNVSRKQLELRIGANQYNTSRVANKTAANTGSFETYQQQHRKWFGERHRKAPVNNFDIDWDQIRRVKEIRDLGSWQRQKQTLSRPISEKSISRILTSTEPVELTATPSIDESQPFIPLEATEFKQFNNKMDFNRYEYEDESLDMKDEPPFGKADKDGKTAFGRLYPESRKRHYRIFDSRHQYFDKHDIEKCINKTYDAEFRIQTHRKTHWHNRTFDPNYVFTFSSFKKNTTKRLSLFPDLSKIQLERLSSSRFVNSVPNINTTQSEDPHFEKYINILRSNKAMSLRPKHVSFRDKENNTILFNVENNDTFILQRSHKIPWDNDSNPDIYKAYCQSRKRFYNKTLDIVFSYYIFHKFQCGNKSRDVGYGRMSNVVNRWYNRTFVPKYRPDMFYMHNKRKAGKEFNYFRDELNTLHAMMSVGNFEPDRWSHFMPNNQSIDISPEENIDTVTIRQTPSWLTTSTTKPKSSFFQSVKEKGFGFFKSLFAKQESTESEE